MICGNPNCFCANVPPCDPRKLSTRDLESKYRLLVSRIEDATQLATELNELGYGIALEDVIGYLFRAAILAHSERELAASEYHFTIKAGVGPGDWKGQRR